MAKKNHDLLSVTTFVNYGISLKLHYLQQTWVTPKKERAERRQEDRRYSGGWTGRQTDPNKQTQPTLNS